MRIQSRSYNKNKRSFSINPLAPHSSRIRKILFKFEFAGSLKENFFYDQIQIMSLFDCIERPNELGFPYWSRSFRGKRIIYDKEDELQENDSEYGYLVTTSLQSLALPSASPSLRLR
ncbi:hypothetical protein HanRHA438_Chr08g0335741 [Helianthus annuus]|uniref:Uncharacterized protein n=1 Tax=Helianthus annuus TaxID=4232 RepID=A0A251U402_HELAN|nr:hypothetical protein HanXRQr2_Chr08g0324481 [Helianthus annuus]KAJ0537830.1 hypothetical protein HanHA300_Chr08g0268181 [Helianthus annuus]KAJ0552416.1 hypothetical protein HanHA89_Chr08g0285021 [Helianthus annuus]KAJ0718116.1 hypothetical protein HanLR1_Chr08g0267081 [Helianthus annuus]KAJ0721351.1 hypothetical protein HanOQP8_Chr08g0274611 [Helianthus annuus]